MWKIVPDLHAPAAVAVYGGADEQPVLVAHAGHYPSAVAADGRTTHEAPHVLISLGGGAVGGVPYYSGVTVLAQGRWQAGQRQARTVFTEVDYTGARRSADFQEWMALGLSKVSEARAALAGLDDDVACRIAMLAEVQLAYPDPLSRVAYTAACAQRDVPALSDEDCGGYGIRYGNFDSLDYSVAELTRVYLARARLRQLDAESAAATAAAAAAAVLASARACPDRAGQLWEPCAHCGAEPVYMPLHLCDACWPK